MRYKLRNIASLILTLFICVSCNGQQSPANLLDSISVAANNGTYPHLEGLTITQNGKTIYEDYFHGFRKDSLHDTRSAFKSVTAILIGIAIDKGFIKGVNEKVYTFFPEYKPYANWSGLKDSMSIEHLLEMTAGFDCEEWEGTKDCEDDMQTRQDWIKFCLDLPLKNKPGSHWDYTSINAMLLGGIITHASHMTVSDFADQYLFKPLGITKYRWTKDPLGHETTAGSFYISTRDMSKIGQIVLNEGVFNGKRIVSENWIREMTAGRIKIEDFSNVRISRNKKAIPQPTFYGYAWYTEVVKTDKFRYNVEFASGNGGQFLMVIRDLNLVVCFSGNSYNSSKSKLPFDILIKYIFPYFDK